MEYKFGLLLVLGITLLGVDGFSGEWSDSHSSEENTGLDDTGYFHVNYATGTCYFFVDRTYNPGEFQVIVMTDRPILDLYVSIKYEFIY